AISDERPEPCERLGAQQRRIAVHDVREALVAIRFGERDAHRVAGATRRVLDDDAGLPVEEVTCGLALFREHDKRTCPHRPQRLADIGGLLPPLDHFGDPTPALAPKLRVALATELRLTRLAAFATKLRVAPRAELRLARFPALATELRVSLRPELALSRLAATPSDLTI